MAPAKILLRERLAHALEDLRRDGKRIVLTNGCYDLLHLGHVRLLQQAKTLGDLLIVAVNSDASVRRLNKGPERPLTPEEARAEVLAALECVDFVTIFDEDTPIETILALRPDVHVKGGDYRAEELPEASAAREVGAEIRILPLVQGFSTTELLRRARS